MCGQVFDGHGGTDAASFVRKNILKFIIEDPYFPNCIEKAIKSAFVRTDHAFADSRSLDRSSGTTALTAVIFGRSALMPISLITIINSNSLLVISRCNAQLQWVIVLLK